MKKVIFVMCDFVVMLWLLAAAITLLGVLSNDPISSGWVAFAFKAVKILFPAFIVGMVVSLGKEK